MFSFGSPSFTERDLLALLAVNTDTGMFSLGSDPAGVSAAGTTRTAGWESSWIWVAGAVSLAGATDVVLAESARVLKPGGRMACVAGNTRV